MSITLIAALAMAGAAPATTDSITSGDRGAVAASAARLNVRTRALFRAVTAPQEPRRSTREVRYCIDRDRIVAGRTGRICHTAQQWERFGITVPRRPA